MKMLIAAVLALAAGASAAELPEPIADGPFAPSWESLQQYEQPQWFADAKFGIWAHWSAQCVPEAGDWYARFLYAPGGPEGSWQKSASDHISAFHRAKYGHPSEFGFKDIINLWKAERFEPEKLMTLYRRAGAKYFVALANHHCNFDAWNSRHHAWNSVNVGPKKDLIGMFAKAARDAGLRFGVSVHAARAWEWYEPAQGADKEGPLAGVPYDGKLTKTDGAGKWWEGLDPQELYASNHKPGEKPSAAYRDKFYLRTKDLIDQHRPDVIYYDDWRVPMDDRVGLALIAHHYNASRQWHDGRTEAVVTTKGLSPQERKAVTLDIERGRSDTIEKYPWQTCTCIGNWHYNAQVYQNNGYKSAKAVLEMLADVVAKNGNLLLSVPLRGDGTPDEKEIRILEDIAAWMAVNEEAIFGTRPWTSFGEGPGTKEKGGMFSESNRPATARDIRFTTRGETLYALALAAPAGREVVIRSLARAQDTPPITRAQWLGIPGNASLRHEPDGLHVQVPTGARPAGPLVLKLEGAARYPAQAVDEDLAVRVGEGTTTLGADTVAITGKAFVEEKTPEGNVGGWTSPADQLTWTVRVAIPGTYRVRVRHAGPASELMVRCGQATLTAKLPTTGPYDRFATTDVGTLRLGGGKQTLTLGTADPSTWRAINLASVQLERME